MHIVGLKKYITCSGETKIYSHGIRKGIILLIGRHPIRQFEMDAAIFIGSFSILKLQYPIIFSPFCEQEKKEFESKIHFVNMNNNYLANMNIFIQNIIVTIINNPLINIIIIDN